MDPPVNLPQAVESSKHIWVSKGQSSDNRYFPAHTRAICLTVYAIYYTRYHEAETVVQKKLKLGTFGNVGVPKLMKPRCGISR